MTDNTLNEMHPNVAPLFAESGKQVKESYDAWKSKGLKQIEEEHTKVCNELLEAKDEMGEDCNLMAVTESLGNGTAAERADVLTKKNGHRTALEALIREKDEFAMKMKNIAEHGFGDGPRNTTVEPKADSSQYGVEDFANKVISSLPVDTDLATASASGDHVYSFDLGNMSDALGLRNAITFTSIPQIIQQGIAFMGQRPVQFASVFRNVLSPNNKGGVAWASENTHTDSVTEIAPGTAPTTESAYQFVEKKVSWEKLVGYVGVTEEQLQDTGMFVMAVEDLLLGDLRRQIDNHAIGGDGASNRWNGIINATAHSGIATNDVTVPTTVAVGTLDKILEAKTKVRTDGRGTANVCFLQSTQLNNIKQLKDTTNRYLLGGPTMDANFSLWSMNVVEADGGLSGGNNNAFEDGNAADEIAGLVCDNRGAFITLGRGARLETGRNGTDFLAGKLTMRVVVRGNVAVVQDDYFVRLKAG